MPLEKYETKKTSASDWVNYQYRELEIMSDAAKRAELKCEWCGANGKHVHHITPRSKDGETKLKNLVYLCEKCHLKAHNNDYFGHCGLNEEMFNFFTKLNKERTPKTPFEIIQYLEKLHKKEVLSHNKMISKKNYVFSAGKCKAYKEIIEILSDYMELNNEFKNQN